MANNPDNCFEYIDIYL